MFIRVVLPEPLTPISATSSPRSMVSDTPFSTGTSTSPRWYVFVKFSSLIRDISLLPFRAAVRGAPGGPPRPALALGPSPAAATEQLGRERIGVAVAPGGGVVLADDQGGAVLEVAAGDLGRGAVGEADLDLHRPH